MGRIRADKPTIRAGISNENPIMTNSNELYPAMIPPLGNNRIPPPARPIASPIKESDGKR